MGPWFAQAWKAAPPIKLSSRPPSLGPAVKREDVQPRRPRTFVPAPAHAVRTGVQSAQIIILSSAPRPRATAPAPRKRPRPAPTYGGPGAALKMPKPAPLGRLVRMQVPVAYAEPLMMLGVPGGTAPIEPVSGRAAVAAAVQHRKLSGTWRLPAFATGGDRRLFHKLTRVGALVDALPDGA